MSDHSDVVHQLPVGAINACLPRNLAPLGKRLA